LPNKSSLATHSSLRSLASTGRFRSRRQIRCSSARRRSSSSARRSVMKRVALLALFALVAVPGLRAQNAQDRWEPAIKKFEEADKISPPPQNAIVFIGASSIVRWNLKESFPELGAQAINRGFGGSLAADSTRYADRIVIPYKPRMVVFYAGDNDVEANHTPQQIAGDFAAFERKVHAALSE